MYKKIASLLLALILLLGVSVFANPVTANSQFRETGIRFEIGNPYFTHNGVMRQSIDGIAPFIDPNYDRAMLPLRTLAEAIGANVGWNHYTRTVTVYRAGMRVDLQIDTPLPGGMGMPMIVNDRTFVPVRYVSDTLGINVNWDRVNRAVYISDPFVGTQPVPTAVPGAEWDQTVRIEMSLLEMTNTIRESYRLRPLEWDADLGRAARLHSADMAQNRFYSHQGSDGSTPQERMERATQNMEFIAENVFAGTDSPQRMMEVWLGSPRQRGHILDPNATHMGAGFYHLPESEHVFYITQVFARDTSPAPSPTPTPGPSPSPSPTPRPTAPAASADFEEEIRRLINEERRNHDSDMRNLSVNNHLRNYARRRSQNMERGLDNVWALGERHLRLRYWEYTRNNDFANGLLVEHVFSGRNVTPQDAVDEWLSNSGTRSNIRNRRFTHIGVGVEFRGTGANREVFITSVLGEWGPSVTTPGALSTTP